MAIEENNTLKAALRYQKLGWKPVLLLPGTKRPGIKGWQSIEINEELLKFWFLKDANYNIGVLTGKPSEIVVLDLDHGFELDSKKYPIPITPKATTPNDGEHFYFNHPGFLVPRKIRILGEGYQGADLIAENSQVVLPPSTLDSGGSYRWALSPWEVELADMPDWLLELVSEPTEDTPKGTIPFDGVEHIPMGQRNETICRVAGSLISRFGEEFAWKRLEEANSKRCKPPLDQKELQSIYNSILRRETSKKSNYALTDYGNAERFGSQHRQDVKYCSVWKSWLVWDGKVWKRDDSFQTYRLAVQTIRSIYTEAASELDDATRTELARHGRNSESESRLRAMINLARSQPEMAISPNNLDADKYLLNVENGTINLINGKLQDHSSLDRITKLAPVEYDESAKCERFKDFLHEIFEGDSELIDYLQRVIGYSLTGDTKEQELYILFGEGANGKSTFINTIMAMLGDYALQTSPETLLVRSNDSANNDVARLQGARLVSAAEIDAGRRLSESLVKQITGGDVVTARRLYQEYFEFVPQAKIFLSTNHKPEIRGVDEGIWRRIRIIPFEVSIPAEKQNKDLSDQLKFELPGILNWAVEGCLEWQEHGLMTPEGILDASCSYRGEMDRLGPFLETCEISDDAKCSAKELIDSYRQWASLQGETPVSAPELLKLMQAKGFQRTRTRNARFWKGIRPSQSSDTGLHRQKRDGWEKLN